MNKEESTPSAISAEAREAAEDILPSGYRDWLGRTAEIIQRAIDSARAKDRETIERLQKQVDETLLLHYAGKETIARLEAELAEANLGLRNAGNEIAEVREKLAAVTKERDELKARVS